jgi:AraC-like DNA-binding protein
MMALIPIAIGMAGLNMNPIYYLHGPLLVFLAAPLSYFYFKSYLSNEYQFNWTDLLHFIPFVIQLILWYYVVVKPLDIDGTRSYLKNLNDIGDIYRLQRKISGFVLCTIYFAIFIKLTWNFHRKAKEEHSYTNNDVLKWVYLLIVAIYIVPFLSGFFAFFKITRSGFYLTVTALISNFASLLIIILRPEIYRGIGAFVKIELKKAVYSLPKIEMVELHKRLLKLMNEKKVYLNQDLSLKNLSTELNSNPNYMSQTINGISKQSFFDFINSYRVDHAKNMLISNNYRQYSMEGIGKESGFRSKSAFYNAFKKYCNMSPTSYRNKFSV